MQGNSTYKGFRYQKKCALYFLLQVFYNRNDFTYITLEHKDGDDFDLHFKSKKEVYQTKDYKKVSTMKEFLTNLWRRYSENIRITTDLDICLFFIFSNDSSNGAFTALKNKDCTSPKLNKLFGKLENDPDHKVKLTKSEWGKFIKILSLQIIEDEEINNRLDLFFTLLFDPYDLKEKEKEIFSRELLDLLDETMALGTEINRTEIRERIDGWHILLCSKHVSFRSAIAEAKKDIVEAKMKTVPANSIGEIE